MEDDADYADSDFPLYEDVDYVDCVEWVENGTEYDDLEDGGDGVSYEEYFDGI